MQGARELADGGASRGGIGRECFDGVARLVIVIGALWSVEEVRECVGGADDTRLTQMRRRLGATGLGEEAWWPVGHKEG